MRNEYKYWYSNEGSLWRLYPSASERVGAILSVGSDQGLDLLANSQCSRLEMVDKAPHIAVVMKAVLEVAKNRFGKSDWRGNLFNDFEYRALRETAQVIKSGLESNDAELALRIFEEGVPLQHGQLPASYASYLRLRSQVKNETGEHVAWYGDDEKGSKIIEAYKSGRITIVTGDLCKEQVRGEVIDRLDKDGEKLGIVYLSNAEDHMQKDGVKQVKDFWKGIRPALDPLGVILRTGQVFGFNRVGRITVSPDDPFYNILNPWHYNSETVEHHLWMMRANSGYANQGWLKVATAYRQLRLTAEGISNLNLDLTRSNAERIKEISGLRV